MFKLNAILSLNTLSCLTFGSLFVAKGGEVKDFLNLPSYLEFLPLASGVVLLGFAVHLMSAILRPVKIKGEIYYFVFGDLLWVVLSGVLMASGLISSGTPTIAVGATAALVGIFAGLQFMAASAITDKNKVSVEGELPTDKEKAWQVLKDFGNISRYHPLVKESSLTGPMEQGVGALRRCVFNDNTEVSEQVTDWLEGVSYTVAINGMNMPLKGFENQIRIFEKHGQRRISLTATFSGTGFISEMMMGFVMRPMMILQLKKVLRGFQEAVLK